MDYGQTRENEWTMNCFFVMHLEFAKEQRFYGAWPLYEKFSGPLHLYMFTVTCLTSPTAAHHTAVFIVLQDPLIFVLCQSEKGL